MTLGQRSPYGSPCVHRETARVKDKEELRPTAQDSHPLSFYRPLRKGR